MNSLIDKILIKLLLLDGNETNMLSYEDRMRFSQLIAEAAKIKYDIRYCTNDNCPCRPEVTFKNILDQSENLKDLLDKNDIIRLLNDLYETYDFENTVYDVGHMPPDF